MNDRLRLCQKLGIAVEYHDLGDSEASCKGVFLVAARIKRILVNSVLADAVMRIILAHELRHAVLHSDKVGIGAPLNELLMYDEKNRLEY